MTDTTPPDEPDFPAPDSTDQPGFAPNEEAHGKGRGNGQAPPGEAVDDADEMRRAFDGAAEDSAEGGADQVWRDDLPTEAMARENHLRILEPARLRALARLRTENLAEYFALLERLAKAAKSKLITRAKLDELVKPEASGLKREKQDVSGAEDDKGPMKILLGICKTFHLSSAEGRVAFADFVHDEHVETANVASEDFSKWLEYRYYKETGRPPPLEMLNAAIRLMLAKARYEAPRRDINLRTSSYIGNGGDRVLLIDLGDDTWRFVKITRHGWEVRERRPTNSDPSGMDGAPVRMFRSTTMLPLPEPIRGGSLLDLAPFLGVEKSKTLQSPVFLLGVGWVLVAITPWGVYLHLLLNGPPGSLKSSVAGRLSGLIDPHEMTERTLPTTVQELAIAARHTAVPVFDNLVEVIPRLLIPALCMAATGGAFATRTHYSNDGESVLKFMRPMIIAGTPEMATATEVAERAIQLPLTKFTGKRLAPPEVEAAWAQALPGILGALFDVIAGGLAQEAQKKSDDSNSGGDDGGLVDGNENPRMVGALNWVSACEPTLGWPAGTFSKAYLNNLDLGAERVADANTVIAALEEFLTGQPEAQGQPGVRKWKGTASSLLAELDGIVGPAAARSQGWPKNPNTLSQKLCNEMAPTLEKLGVVVVRGARQSGGNRSLKITSSQKTETQENSQNTSSPPSPGKDVSEQEAKMQSQTTESERALGDDPPDDVVTRAPAKRDRHQTEGDGGGHGDEPPPASPSSQASSRGSPPRKNLGKPPLSRARTPIGDEVTIDTANCGGIVPGHASFGANPDQGGAEPDADTVDPEPLVQPSVVPPSGTPRRRLRIKGKSEAAS